MYTTKMCALFDNELDRLCGSADQSPWFVTGCYWYNTDTNSLIAHSVTRSLVNSVRYSLAGQFNGTLRFTGQFNKVLAHEPFHLSIHWLVRSLTPMFVVWEVTKITIHWGSYSQTHSTRWGTHTDCPNLSHQQTHPLKEWLNFNLNSQKLTAARE
jgi:hypothetical protein